MLYSIVIKRYYVKNVLVQRLSTPLIINLHIAWTYKCFARIRQEYVEKLKEGVKSVSILKSELNKLSAVDTFKGGLGRVSSGLMQGELDFTLNSI
jgi:hypothetical protein